MPGGVVLNTDMQMKLVTWCWLW